MPVIKINHIVNLQDARYCAAMNIEMLGFCLERGHIRKLADNTVNEIEEWLSGPEAVLDFGQDYEGAATWLANNPDEQRKLQVDIPGVDAAIPALPRENLILSLPLKEADERFAEQLLILASQCAYLEIRPNKFSKKMAALVQRLIEESFNLIVNIDAAGPKMLDSFEQKPYGIAFRDLASADTFELDYDKCEALMESFRAFD